MRSFNPRSTVERFILTRWCSYAARRRRETRSVVGEARPSLYEAWRPSDLILPRRRAELESLVADKKSDYFGDKQALHDPDEYRRVGAFDIPEAARCENVCRRRRSRLSLRVSDLYNLSPRVSP